ncbi:DUF4040 family protein [Corynebacterium sp. TAE3-ERU30]|uniref:DUF4040 family protein n=1 Tax=Corynebacterium sp. TAE3-ERU30 TaxID=2849496 RepID=UPI001C47FF53|nr:DUF4040 family protein [Corynebacterium sp. TAE3-ERU30]MBV7282408.1 DUF4040 family protein [Corynebacterium sp. TAE3-ERU30]
MTLSTVLLLVAATVVLAPLAVRLGDRLAGWPLALLFFAAAGVLAAKLPDIIDGDSPTFSMTWISDFAATGVDVNLNFIADPLSTFFALLALVIGGVVFIYSAAYLHNDDFNLSFYWLMSAFTFSILLLVLTDDIVVLFIAWELVSMASFMLIGRAKGSSGQMGAIRTLILTFTGGLTLLTAVAIMVAKTGTTSIREILASDFWAADPNLTTVLAVLVAVSAFTKSAQLPFHFWLPEAMAAATPVSAFLHAAAVVKAGVYVLMRFSAVFADNHTWNVLLISVGMTTAVMAAFFAIQKTDLKSLTAYSTVSHLGWIVATIGVGTPFALAAALVHTLAHGLFKSSLFMLIGVVDHQAGSRDIRRLGPLYKKMPFTFASAAIGLMSMAAVPPLFGFVSKEGMLEAFTEAPLTSTGVSSLLIAAAVGAWFTFSYSARFLFGAFIDGDRSVDDVHEAPVSLWLPAALPGLMSLPIVFVLGVLDKPIAAAVGSVAAEPELHLALWHGVNTPFMISMGVLAAGLLTIIYRKPLFKAIGEYTFAPFTGNQALAVLMGSAAGWGKAVGRMADSFSPSRHLAPPLVVVCILGFMVSFFSGGVDGVAMPPRVEGTDTLLDLVPLLIVVMSVSGLMRAKSRLHAVVLVGTAGVGVTLQVLLLGAPDVALTQFTVEILITVMMMLVVRLQPRYFHRTSDRRRYWSAVLAIATGIVTFLAVYGLLARNGGRSEIAQWYIDNAPEISGGTNIVAVILVEFRALDTLGELSVLGMAGVVIYSVVYSVPKHSFLPGTKPPRFGFEDLNATPLRHVFKVVVPVLMVLSVLIFLRGHEDPGGGFVAALVAGGAIALGYLAKPADERIVKPNTPFLLIGFGIILALTPGFLGLTEGSFLYAIHGHIGDIHLTTSLIFDMGIYLAVLGMITMGINALGGRLRPGAYPGDLAFVRDDESPLPDVSFDEDPEAELTDPDFHHQMDVEKQEGKKVHQQ